MDELFDKLATDSANGVSRRQMFRKFGWGVAVAVFGMVGAKRVSADSCVQKCCTSFCNAIDMPPGVVRGQCISDCMRGVAGTFGGVVRTQCETSCS